jgi:hypothetical protein
MPWGLRRPTNVLTYLVDMVIYDFHNEVGEKSLLSKMEENKMSTVHVRHSVASLSSPFSYKTCRPKKLTAPGDSVLLLFRVTARKTKPRPPDFAAISVHLNTLPLFTLDAALPMAKNALK